MKAFFSKNSLAKGESKQPVKDVPKDIPKEPPTLHEILQQRTPQNSFDSVSVISIRENSRNCNIDRVKAKVYAEYNTIDSHDVILKDKGLISLDCFWLAIAVFSPNLTGHTVPTYQKNICIEGLAKDGELCLRFKNLDGKESKNCICIDAKGVHESLLRRLKGLGEPP